MRNTILIAEDNIYHLRRIIKYLEQAEESYKLMIAKDGRQALYIAEREMPDLIITDWEMPKFTGIQLIDLLKKNDKTKNIPIVMATGHNTDSVHLQSALNAGAADYIPKPIDKIVLLARVKSALLANKSTYLNKTRILFLSANPKDTTFIRLCEEIREISNGLKMAKEREKFTILQEWAVTPQTFQQALLDEAPNIVHFSGHGVQSSVEKKKIAGIAFEGKTGYAKIVNGEALGSIFELFAHHIYCVVLNACFSKVQAEEIVKYVPFVIGMSREINDASAIAFSVGFYKALGAGKEVPFAFNLGVSSIKLHGLPDANVPELLSNRINI